ncbi:poly(A)-specific ribonuclease SCDLUD_001073 [Saccharomycodes ludwigii]|uniref:poly(A)-specific ribonuclease n=1 Tax=Saccharomycodes ludwigii TaxID=36035 RepID=UPI001E83314D|nr:hypothetical protein SCDLUD_001073 [Saccharomycodes ludwigii]KAH3903434.1 hypothetical protein SCDLUD_001073 [Saccharomycodes ludwigii]
MDNWIPCYHQPEDLIPHLHHNPQLRLDSRIPKKITKTFYDKYSDLYWVGDSIGKLSAYYRQVIPSGQSVQQHSLNTYHLYTRHSVSNFLMGPAESGIFDGVSTPDGLLTVTDTSLNFSNRRGLLMANYTSLNLHELTYGIKAITANDFSNTNCFIGGSYDSIFNIDYKQGKLVSRIDYYMKNINVMKSSDQASNKLIFVGNDNGSVDIIDTTSNKVVTSLKAHASYVSDIDVANNTLVTVGKTKKFDYISDPYVRVFDLRIMRDLTPIAFTAGADFVHLHPVLPSVVVTASNFGQFQFTDMFNPTLTHTYTHPGKITHFNISYNGDYLGIVGSDESMIHTWSRTGGTTRFLNSMSSPLEFADMNNDLPAKEPFKIDDYTKPLSSVGMSSYDELLLSSWNNTIFNSSGTVPNFFRPDLKFPNGNANGIYNANTPSFHSLYNKYHLIPYNKSSYGPPYEKYISIKHVQENMTVNDESLKWEIFKLDKENGSKNLSNASTVVQPTVGNTTNVTSLSTSLSSLSQPTATSILSGSPPLLFRRVKKTPKTEYSDLNNTKYCGLINLPDGNAPNSLIQLYKFTPYFNNLAREHLLKPFVTTTLIHELGYVFDCIGCENKSKCFFPKNFIELVRYMRKKDSNDIKYINKFICKTISKETKVSLRANYDEVLILNSTANKRQSTPTILHYIEHSFNSFKNNIAGFNNSLTSGSKKCSKLPESFVLNVDISSADLNEKCYGKNHNWLLNIFHLGITKLNNQFIFKENAEDLPRFCAEKCEYELNGFVAKVKYNDNMSHNYVTFVKIYQKTNTATEYKWFMFNDFVVVEMPEEIVLDFKNNWKVPQVIIYTKKDVLKEFCTINNDYINSITHNVPQKIFAQEFTRLTNIEEVPVKGTLLAMDSEFVLASNNKYHIDCNGNVDLIQAARVVLARISVLYGDYKNMGKIMFDDYIIHKGHIGDYLTRYSGISPGDLDPDKSNKKLCQRQLSYRKFWLLIKLGCIIVGHGLPNDFAGIGIYVPNNQVEDTATYFWQGGRYLSLRYLAHVLLKNDIQTGDHDSIEDAHNALLLFKEYLNLKATGDFEGMIDKIFREGRAVNYKVPSEAIIDSTIISTKHFEEKE